MKTRQARPAARKIIIYQPGPASFRPTPGLASKISLKPGRPGPAHGLRAARAEARPVQERSAQHQRVGQGEGSEVGTERRVSVMGLTHHQHRYRVSNHTDNKYHWLCVFVNRLSHLESRDLRERLFRSIRNKTLFLIF